MIINSMDWSTLFTFRNDPSLDSITTNSYPSDVFTYRNYEDTDYWYVEIMHGDAFSKYPIETLMSPEILERVHKREVVIIVSHFSEAYHSIINGLYDTLIIHAGVPPEQILLLTNSPDIMTEIDFVSRKHNLPPIKAEWLITYEWTATFASNHFPSPSENCYATDTLSATTYQKKFLSFNGQPRSHRTLLMGLMCAYDLLSQGHISYNCYVHSHDVRDQPSGLVFYHAMLISAAGYPQVLSLLEENAERICQLESMFLDSSIDTQRGFPALSHTKKEYYEETYFSVVTETLCYNRSDNNIGDTGIGRILSEKTFKAIINRHPFILLAVPKSLELLRRLGYKTFSPWIDESYDDESDDILRTLRVAEEVRKLATLSDDKLAEFLIFAREIVEYNFNNLKSKPPPRTVPLTMVGISHNASFPEQDHLVSRP